MEKLIKKFNQGKIILDKDNDIEPNVLEEVSAIIVTTHLNKVYKEYNIPKHYDEVWAISILDNSTIFKLVDSTNPFDYHVVEIMDDTKDKEPTRKEIMDKLQHIAQGLNDDLYEGYFRLETVENGKHFTYASSLEDYLNDPYEACTILSSDSDVQTLTKTLYDCVMWNIRVLDTDTDFSEDIDTLQELYDILQTKILRADKENR